MPINKNHEFEDLDGIKCAVVEKNVPQARVDFLRKLLEWNGYTVVVVASPLPKAAPAPVPAPAAEGAAEVPAPPPPPLPPATFTLGVTDVMFNATNAIFGRLLKTPEGYVVSFKYWKQKEAISQDEVPYYENK